MRVDQRIGDSRSLLAEAVALQESGILISGMTVTDLATGFAVTGDAQMQQPGYLQYRAWSDPTEQSRGRPLGETESEWVKDGEDKDVEFQRSGLSLGRLSELYEMLCEVFEQRAEHPDAAAVNPPEPRERFPWGIGLREVDVLVTGTFAVKVVHYLRIRGVRARLVDNDTVLRVASELALAQQELEHLELEYLDPDKPVRIQREGIESAEELEEADIRERPDEGASIDIEKAEGKSDRRLPAALAALTLFIIGGLVATFTVFDSQAADSQTADSQVVDAQSTDSQAADVQESGSYATTEANEPFPEPRRKGSKVADSSARRADIPISVNVDGWRLGSATRAREEYVGDDAGMRVLVAAKQTPLRTQDELDAAMLGALKDVEGVAGGVTVVSTQPVSYEENYENSTTRWHVRLVDGHQVSVGCQYRQWNEQREKVCQEFVDTARPRR